MTHTLTRIATHERARRLCLPPETLPLLPHAPSQQKSTLSIQKVLETFDFQVDRQHFGCFVRLKWFCPVLFAAHFCGNFSKMELSLYERDVKVAKDLKTLQENTDPENLVPATKHRIEANDRDVPASPSSRPAAGALTIAQVWSLCLQITLCAPHTPVPGTNQRDHCCGSFF